MCDLNGELTPVSDGKSDQRGNRLVLTAVSDPARPALPHVLLPFRASQPCSRSRVLRGDVAVGKAVGKVVACSLLAVAIRQARLVALPALDVDADDAR